MNFHIIYQGILYCFSVFYHVLLLLLLRKGWDLSHICSFKYLPTY